MVSVISGIFLIVLIREIKHEYAVFAGVLLGVFIILQVIPEIKNILDYTVSLMENGIGDLQIALLYKSIGASFLCCYVSDLCRECGLDTVASKTELFGKIYITSLSLPLIDSIFSMIHVF